MKVAGGCHCGAVRFEAEVPPAVEAFDCNCSMCAKSGYRHLIVPGEAFRLTAGADELTEYRFNTGTARHLFCRTCGVKSFYVPRSHPEGYSINLRALDDPAALDVTITPYDGRDWETARKTMPAGGA